MPRYIPISDACNIRTKEEIAYYDEHCDGHYGNEEHYEFEFDDDDTEYDDDEEDTDSDDEDSDMEEVEEATHENCIYKRRTLRAPKSMFKHAVRVSRPGFNAILNLIQHHPVFNEKVIDW
ncbi:hypothetical protein BGZ76_002551 [Entomortierella beljakovae]|nr:hypothetical protein BGZ76_002551 [Entomortierella beljakovae]